MSVRVRHRHDDESDWFTEHTGPRAVSIASRSPVLVTQRFRSRPTLCNPMQAEYCKLSCHISLFYSKTATAILVEPLGLQSLSASIPKPHLCFFQSLWPCLHTTSMCSRILNMQLRKFDLQHICLLNRIKRHVCESVVMWNVNYDRHKITRIAYQINQSINHLLLKMYSKQNKC